MEAKAQESHHDLLSSKRHPKGENMTEVASVFQNFEICRLIFSNRLPSGRVGMPIG